MIVHLNGWPGAGKLTVGRVLARRLGGHLLDNHTLHNVAASLCGRDTDEYWQVYYQVREIAYARMRVMPVSEIFVMTNALTRESAREVEAWGAVKRLAPDRVDTLVAVTLLCSLEENVRRLPNQDRIDNRKLADPRPLIAWRSGLNLITDDAVHWSVMDNTDLSPKRSQPLCVNCANDRGLPCIPAGARRRSGPPLLRPPAV